MKKWPRFISLAICALSIVVFNPTWPIWGHETSSQYVPLGNFLKMDIFSPFQKFSAVFGLACLYLGTTILLISFVLSFILRKKRIITILDCVSIGLLILCGLFMGFSCQFSSMPFVLYCFIPVVAGILLFLLCILNN